MANLIPNAKPFTKGDPRINRKGRPKSFDALRDLAKQIASEPITSADGRVKMTRVELILREMSISKDPRQRIGFLEIAYGKVPTPIDIEANVQHSMNFNEIIAGGDTD
jgi:hypothetical protein